MKGLADNAERHEKKVFWMKTTMFGKPKSPISSQQLLSYWRLGQSVWESSFESVLGRDIYPWRTCSSIQG